MTKLKFLRQSEKRQRQAARLYQKYKSLMEEMCRSFWLKHGGDYEEYLSHANEIFWRAFTTYQRKSGPFKKWLTFLLWKIMFEHMRRRAGRQARIPRCYPDLERMACRSANPWREGLTDQSLLVAEMVLNPPLALKLELAEEASADPYRKPDNVQWALLVTLREMGWTMRQIQKSFAEIRKALS